MSTEQQYRVIGKSGPGSLAVGVLFSYLDHEAWLVTAMHGVHVECCKAKNTDRHGSISTYAWNDGRYEILEAISPPQAAPVVCLAWCGLPVSHRLVPAPSQATRFFACIFPNGCHGKDCGGHRAYCTQACLDRAKAAKAPECIRSACKAPPVAGGELCAAHAGQVEAAKAATKQARRCAWLAWRGNGVGTWCGLPSVDGRLCTKHEAELRASDAKPNPPPAETRHERWRREHKGYSHGTADPRIHDANVAAMMVGRDGPREPYVPPPKLPAWTPRDLDGDVPDAWEPGGARLGR